jgi:hypothetical protein
MHVIEQEGKTFTDAKMLPRKNLDYVRVTLQTARGKSGVYRHCSGDALWE